MSAERPVNQDPNFEKPEKKHIKKVIAAAIAAPTLIVVGLAGQYYADEQRDNNINAKVEQRFPTKNSVPLEKNSLLAKERETYREQIETETPKDVTWGMLSILTAVTGPLILRASEKFILNDIPDAKNPQST